MKNFKKLIVLVLFLAVSVAVNAQAPVKVSGVVTSAEDGQPLIGAAVLAGPGNGVVTSLDGDYVIEVPAGTELTFSCIGYLEQKIVVPQGATFVCNVVMETESMKLDDVVVIAYGVRKKGTIAGSVSTVKSDKLKDTPTAAFDQALQGQVAGLTVLTNTRFL